MTEYFTELYSLNNYTPEAHQYILEWTFLFYNVSVCSICLKTVPYVTNFFFSKTHCLMIDINKFDNIKLFYDILCIYYWLFGFHNFFLSRAISIFDVFVFWWISKNRKHNWGCEV